MEIITIYKQLWKFDYQYAADIASDDSMLPSIRAIALFILGDYAGVKRLYKIYVGDDNESNDDPYWLEVQLMLEISQGQSVPNLLRRAETAILHNKDSVYARILLAAILVTKGECQKAINHYQSVLADSPTNVLAIDGLVKAYICARQSDNARFILKTIRSDKLLERLNLHTKVYWQFTFFIYSFVVMTERRLTLALFALVMGFLPPVIWILYIITTVAASLLIALFWGRKNKWLSFIMVRFTILVFLACLIGYGTKLLFFALEGF